jgi:hypothetical protein
MVCRLPPALVGRETKRIKPAKRPAISVTPSMVRAAISTMARYQDEHGDFYSCDFYEAVEASLVAALTQKAAFASRSAPCARTG